MTSTTTYTKAAATTVATAAASGGSLLQTISALLEQLAQLQNLLGVEPCGAPPRPAGRRSPATTGRGYASSPSRRCRPTPTPATATAPAPRRWQDTPFCADDTDPTDSWDWPWDQMSVVELRALLRCYPIDRTALPAPIELLRRDELLAALHELQPHYQELLGG
ncbi:MAG: hypothetical protein NTW51_14450 [Cyanobacteria bacterium]|nr:hypothetical protein [Cyanobacteriota bacterium]